MNVILSIHPKWAKLIYEGTKTIEWRKHERKHALMPNRMDLKGGHHHRRNYCICNMCGHWFRRNKGIHDEDKYGPIHICCGVCYELAIQSANLEADVGGGFQANYWDQEEIEEWEKKNSSLTE